MDLRRNKYLGLDAAGTTAFAAIVEGWPVAATRELDAEGSQTIRELLDAGLLERSAGDAMRACRTPCVAPCTALIDGYVDVPTPIGWLDVVRFLYASTMAWALLKLRSLEATVARVSRRREQIMQRAAMDTGATGCDRFTRLTQLTAVFARMRTFLFTAQDQCLFESLALSEFLACYGFAPHWVFGVAAQPFSAHCWLQQGDVVVNDTPDHTRVFTPIMQV